MVITLLLMILLAVAAVGLLGLSAVSLRGGSQAEARANARLALVIAIGEMQKQLGPDQRVSAIVAGLALCLLPCAAQNNGKVSLRFFSFPKSLEPVKVELRLAEEKTVALDAGVDAFGGGKFLFMNAAKVDVAGVVGEEKFVVKPGPSCQASRAGRSTTAPAAWFFLSRPRNHAPPDAHHPGFPIAGAPGSPRYEPTAPRCPSISKTGAGT